MTIQAQKKLFTVDDYYKMAQVGILDPTDRVELIRGEIITRSPINSLHASIVDRLMRLLIQKLQDQFIVRCQNPIHIDEYSEPEPDLVIAKFQEDEYFSQHPLPYDVYLVIEVADTTLKQDRKVKLALYAEVDIPEVWIVNLKERTIEIYAEPLDGNYHSKTSAQIGEKVKCLGLNFHLEVDRIFGKR